jgi:hypothetical protein
MWLEGGDMSATAKIVGAAGLGALANWLFEGEFSFKSFLRMLANMAISGAAAVIAIYFIDSLATAPDFIQWAIAGIVGSATGNILKRIETAHLSAKLPGGVLEIDSEGTSYASKTSND